MDTLSNLEFTAVVKIFQISNSGLLSSILMCFDKILSRERVLQKRAEILRMWLTPFFANTSFRLPFKADLFIKGRILNIF